MREGVSGRRPFHVEARVVLPDHMHCERPRPGSVRIFWTSARDQGGIACTGEHAKLSGNSPWFDLVSDGYAAISLPVAGLIKVDGALYGTTEGGGARGNGAVFVLTS